jgi:hypothetical protein
MMRTRTFFPHALVAMLLGTTALGLNAQQRYWYDGDVRRPLWADERQVADFSTPRGEKSWVLKPASVTKEGASLSPVFRDGPGEKSRSRALPGGVVVTLPAGTDDARRAALFARHGLEPVRGLGAEMWLVAAAPGVASLDLANRLHESGDFKAAAPNWWQPRALK